MKPSSSRKRPFFMGIKFAALLLGGMLIQTAMMRCQAAHAPEAVNLVEIGRMIPGYLAANTREMPSADFDGDGMPDVAILGRGGDTDLLQIVGYSAKSGWLVKQTLVARSSPGNAPPANLFALEDANGASLIYISGSVVSVYTGWPLALARQFSMGSIGITDAAIGDTDASGRPELVVAAYYTDRSLRAYSLDSGDLLWSVPGITSYDTTVIIAQLDADPAGEIVLGGTPGMIIDGATHALEWQYKDGFGARLVSGRFSGSSPRLAALEGRLVMFQSQPWSPLWDFDNVSADVAIAMDVDGDDVDELVFGSNSFPRGIRVMDTQLQAIRHAFDDEYVVQIAGADFDGDTRAEIAVGEGSYYYPYQYPDRFRVLDAESGVTEFAIPATAPGPYVAGGFISGPDGNDLIVGSNSGVEYPGTLARIDPASGILRWQTPANDPSLNLTQIRNLVVTRIGGIPDHVVVASGFGDPFGNGRIVAVDASNGMTLWKIDSTNSPIADGVWINGIATVDEDDDSTTDSILACTSDSKLRQFDVADQSEIWSSVTMSGECESSISMTTGGRHQLVAVMSGSLRAYDAETHLLNWTLPVASGITGAGFVPHGASGAEIAVFSDWVIKFYDAETRAFLREFTFSDLHPIQGVAQAEGGSIHELLLAIDNKLHAVDGVSGQLRASSVSLGSSAGQFNQIATSARSDGTVEVGIGSDATAFAYILDGRGNEIFANGFDQVPP